MIKETKNYLLLLAIDRTAGGFAAVGTLCILVARRLWHTMDELQGRPTTIEDCCYD